MAMNTVFLLDILEELSKEEFVKFKWLMNQEECLGKFPKISKSKLEDAERIQTVDYMFNVYADKTIEVTKILLKGVNRNNLREKILQEFPETTDEIYGFQCAHKSRLKVTFQGVFEGIAEAGKKTSLDEIYTELYITEGGTGKVNDKQEVKENEGVFIKEKIT